MSIGPYANVYNVPVNFEGAETNYKVGLRGIFKGEADKLAARELTYLQARSAHLCRNNGYAKIALKNWVTKAGYVKTVWKTKDGKSHNIMQGYWDEFAANPCVDGYGDIKVMQGVSNSSLFITGNSYIRKLIIRNDNSNTVPLKLQQIPSLLHDTFWNTAITDQINKPVRYGIKFNNSVPESYFFRKSLLEQAEMYKPSLTHIEVPANELIHSFIREEPGQWLGIPLLGSVILSLYALEDLMTATVNKQKAAQSISVIVESTGQALAQLPVGGVTTVKDENGDDKLTFQNSTDESQVLYPKKGEAVKMFQGADIGNNFGVLIEKELRKVATVADALYHELTGDTAGLNYSSLIGLGIQSRNRLEYLFMSLFIPLRDKPIADTFKELAVLYNPKCASAVPYFQLPRWRGIDELKDIQADLLELQTGMGIVPDKLAERGLTMEDLEADKVNRDILASMGINLTLETATASTQQSTNTQSNTNSTSM